MIYEVLFNTATGVLANAVTKVIEAFWSDNSTSALSIPEESSPHTVELFKTFSIRFGFESVVKITNQPVVHVLVETEPTSAWHLVSLVIESATTGIWYASQKYEMTFEGTGGGLAVAKDVARFCKENNIPVAGWVLTKEDTDNLSKGITPWPELKSRALPLLTYAKNDYFAKYIIGKYHELNHDTDSTDMDNIL